MLRQIAARREGDARARQRAVSELQEEARPFLERSLEALRRAEAAAPAPNASVLPLKELADQMNGLGAAPSARILMREAFDKSAGGDADTRVTVGLALVRLLVASKGFDDAVRNCNQLKTAVSTLKPTDERIDDFWELKIDVEMRAGFFEDALESIQIRSTLKGSTAEVDASRREELRLLQVELVAGSNDD